MAQKLEQIIALKAQNALLQQQLDTEKNLRIAEVEKRKEAEVNLVGTFSFR